MQRAGSKRESDMTPDPPPVTAGRTSADTVLLPRGTSLSSPCYSMASPAPRSSRKPGWDPYSRSRQGSAGRGRVSRMPPSTSWIFTPQALLLAWWDEEGTEPPTAAEAGIEPAGERDCAWLRTNATNRATSTKGGWCETSLGSEGKQVVVGSGKVSD